MAGDRFLSYLEALKGDFVKVAKLDFLNEDGTVAFTLDNDPKNRRSGAFLQSGDITCNLNNGMRREGSITLSNLSGDYDFSVNRIWYGMTVRLSEGLILSDGSEYLIPQGVFEILQPNEQYKPDGNSVTYRLVDKWARLDGSLGGNLDGAYSVNAGTNILAAIASLLRLGRYDMENNSPQPIDPMAPLLTNYYNDKTQTLTDGTVVSLVDAPYDYVSSEDATIADVILGLGEMLAAWVGYNQIGRLEVDPSQDDIADQTKPVLWDFTADEKQLLHVEYEVHSEDLFNDLIVVGDTSDTGYTARARAQNRDISSDTCISRIGLKTKRMHAENYYSDDICAARAEWELKRAAVLPKTVSIECTQMFHIVENGIVTIRRDDKTGAPVERHVVQGWTRPIGQTGTMIINAVSTMDYPEITLLSDIEGDPNAIAGLAVAGMAIAGTSSN